MNSRAILADLVAFPSVSRNSNQDICGYVRDRLQRHRFRVDWLANGGKVNVFASIGPATDDGLLLSGHTDVVPVDGQSWRSDPFRLVERDGRLHARGAADMKGFLACMLSLAGRLSPQTLRAPVHLCFSCDEEIGCVGVRPMLDRLAARGFKARLCVVGEPTEGQVVVGHKGKLAARAVCAGVAAHSALAPRALNAIHLAADLVGILCAEQERLQGEGARDDAYDIPCSTVHAGIIAGGTALNIVPDRCTVDFELRTVGGDDAHALLGAIAALADAAAAAARRRFPQAGIAITETNAYPGLDMSAADPATLLVQRAAGGQGVGKVAFGTEAGLFVQRLGLPTLVCGPGSMEQGHKVDEFIAAEQLDRCDAMLDRLVAMCCGV